jgi:hypothetical protein
VGRRLEVLNEWEGRGVLGTGRWIGVLCCECEYLEGVGIRSRMLNTRKGRTHEYIWRGNFNVPRPMNELSLLVSRGRVPFHALAPDAKC